MFKSFNGKISLTSDIWYVPLHCEPYMFVTAYWIHHNWFIQKTIIVFELVSKKYNGHNIKFRLIEACKEWSLLDKIFSSVRLLQVMLCSCN